METTQHKNFKEMLNRIDPGAYDDIKDIAQKRSWSMMLVRMRIKAGMTQRDMATSLGCTQSRISKLETATNDHISIQDLLDYGRTTGMGMLDGCPESSALVTLTYKIA